jgi:hypothetical protein
MLKQKIFTRCKNMVKKTGAEVAHKWAQRLKASTKEIEAGVDALTTNPFEQARKQKDKLIKNFIEAMESGRWDYEISKFSLEDFKKFMKEVGIPRIAKGVDMSLTDQEKFFNALMEHIYAGKATIDKMPLESLDDSVNKAGAMIRHMAKFKKQEKVK